MIIFIDLYVAIYTKLSVAGLQRANFFAGSCLFNLPVISLIPADVSDISDTASSNGYYLVYYNHWSLTEFGFLSQLLCYIALFLFMVALLKCCHVLLSEGDDDEDNNKLSVSADYVSVARLMCTWFLRNWLKLNGGFF